LFNVKNPFFRLKTIKIDRPMAVSALAIVRMKTENNSPITSSRYEVEIKKNKFIDKRISSNDRIINSKFFLLRKIPKNPNEKVKKEIKTKVIKIIVLSSKRERYQLRSAL
jgi:hypothetical protein